MQLNANFTETVYEAMRQASQAACEVSALDQGPLTCAVTAMAIATFAGSVAGVKASVLDAETGFQGAWKQLQMVWQERAFHRHELAVALGTSPTAAYSALVSGLSSGLSPEHNDPHPLQANNIGIEEEEEDLDYDDELFAATE